MQLSRHGPPGSATGYSSMSATMKATTVPVVSPAAAVEAIPYVATTSSPAGMAVIPTATPVTPAVAIAPAVVVPGARADEHATVKQIWAIVPNGCAGVGWIR